MRPVRCPESPKSSAKRRIYEISSNPLGVVFPKPYFTTPPRPMYGWLTAHPQAVCPLFPLRTLPPIPTVKPNRIDGKADFICIATTATELLPIGPLARWYTHNSAGRVQVRIIGHLTKMLVLVIEHRRGQLAVHTPVRRGTLHDEVGASPSTGM